MQHASSREGDHLALGREGGQVGGTLSPGTHRQWHHDPHVGCGTPQDSWGLQEGRGGRFPEWMGGRMGGWGGRAGMGLANAKRGDRRVAGGPRALPSRRQRGRGTLGARCGGRGQGWAHIPTRSCASSSSSGFSLRPLSLPSLPCLLPSLSSSPCLPRPRRSLNLPRLAWTRDWLAWLSRCSALHSPVQAPRPQHRPAGRAPPPVPTSRAAPGWAEAGPPRGYCPLPPD